MALNDREHPGSRELPVLRRRRVVPPLDARLRGHDKGGVQATTRNKCTVAASGSILCHFPAAVEKAKTIPCAHEKIPCAARVTDIFETDFAERRRIRRNFPALCSKAQPTKKGRLRSMCASVHSQVTIALYLRFSISSRICCRFALGSAAWLWVRRLGRSARNAVAVGLNAVPSRAKTLSSVSLAGMYRRTPTASASLSIRPMSLRTHQATSSSL